MNLSDWTLLEIEYALQMHQPSPAFKRELENAQRAHFQSYEHYLQYITAETYQHGPH